MMKAAVRGKAEKNMHVKNKNSSRLKMIESNFIVYNTLMTFKVTKLFKTL